ncbi:hypothetical protein [Streptomyces sp. AP-93]|uniref:hypothetical protein n=1 Tax=Streptomyces sp. AP-93 TaxID=2929048 RepID=UPI001FAE7A9E|nr:hypothetical protein [Streptomyces sp. AP-93]MCJ0875228.1 hypothetical protein [Streptomyces sp. AP-93]
MFGTIGTGGAILLIIVALVVYKKGGGKFKPVKDHTVVYWAFALGLLSASAGESFRQVGTVSETISQAVTSQSSTVGLIGAGAVALLLLLVAFGFKPAMAKDLIVGVSLPGALSAAGGVLALPVTICGSLLRGLVG